MTKPRVTSKTTKAIEVAFTPCDLVSKPGDVPVMETLGFHKVTRLQTEELDRVGCELAERIEAFFHDYEVDRTGDDLADFRNLALQMAIKLLPVLGLKDNPSRLEGLFQFFNVNLWGGSANTWAYKSLVAGMAEGHGLLRIEKQSYDRKPSNPLALLQLFADEKALNAERQMRAKALNAARIVHPYSDSQIAAKLVEQEPFKARWGDLSAKTLRYWLGEAHKLFKCSEDLSECPEN
jgi:hypothetical protein